MNRSAWSTALGVLVTLAACGGASTPSTVDPVDVTRTAQASVTAYDYMPADSFGVMRVDVARGMSSPYFSVLTDALGQLQGREAQVRDKALEFAALIDVGYLSIGPHESNPNRTEPGVAVLEGRFTLQQAQELLLSIEPSEQPSMTEVGGFQALRIDDVIMISVGQGRFLFGPHARVSALAQNPPRSGFEQNAAFAQVRTTIDESAIFSVMTQATEAVRNEVRGEVPPAVAMHITGAGLSVDAMDGVQVRGVATVDDATASEAIATQANGMRDELLQQPELAAFGVRPLIEAIQISHNATAATLNMDIPDAEVRRLIQMAMGFIGMMGAAATPPPPPVQPAQP